MEIYHRTSIHDNNRSYDMVITEIKGTKIKMIYEAYNAGEHCTTEFFDGKKWNQVLSIYDLGFMPDKSAYIKNPDIRKKTAENLFKIATSMSELILS